MDSNLRKIIAGETKVGHLSLKIGSDHYFRFYNVTKRSLNKGAGIFMKRTADILNAFKGLLSGNIVRFY